MSDDTVLSLPVVEVLRWPVDPDRRQAMQSQGQLCLFLVEAHDLPPDDLSQFEEWVRATADPIEVHWRTRQLQKANLRDRRPPRILESTLVFRDRRALLSPADESVAALLCENFEQVVDRRQLRMAERYELTESALSARIHRLRRLLRPIGLTISTIRGRGCMLQAAELHT